MQTLGDLQHRFAIPGVLTFEEGPGGLIRLVVKGPLAEGVVYLHGAHVAHYQPTGQKPVLWMSAKSVFDSTKPIRGGVPICYPWFGPRQGDPAAGIHGFARVQPWTVQSTVMYPDGSVTVDLRLKDTEATRKIWTESFSLRYVVTFGKTLDMYLEAYNPGTKPVTFEEALHTYFAVSDVRQVAISGLGGTSYLDKPEGMKRKQQNSDPIRIEAETDRVYLHTQTTCVIDDPKGGRRILVEKKGSDTTVVWNPWIAKAKAMPDFGDEEWPQMLCVETCNAGESAVTLAGSQKHRMVARIRTESR